MAKLDEQGNLTLTQAEVMKLRGEVYVYGQEVLLHGAFSTEASLRLRQIRCMLPVPDVED